MQRPNEVDSRNRRLPRRPSNGPSRSATAPAVADEFRTVAARPSDPTEPDSGSPDRSSGERECLVPEETSTTRDPGGWETVRGAGGAATNAPTTMMEDNGRHVKEKRVGPQDVVVYPRVGRRRGRARPRRSEPY